MSEPTREEMVEWIIDIDRKYRCLCLVHPQFSDPVTEKDKQIFQAIRSHLTESDIAHWMDRCHELEVKLAEKPEPVRVSIIMEDAKFLALIPFVEDLIPVLKSMNIEVSDGETEEA